MFHQLEFGYLKYITSYSFLNIVGLKVAILAKCMLNTFIITCGEYVLLGDSRYLVGIGIYFGKPKKKETFIYNSS